MHDGGCLYAGVPGHPVQVTVTFEEAKHISRIELVADAWGPKHEPPAAASDGVTVVLFSPDGGRIPSKEEDRRIPLASGTRCVVRFGPPEGGEREHTPVPRAAVPRCFDEWCSSRRHDPPCESTVPPAERLQDRYAVKQQYNYGKDDWDKLTAVLDKMEPSFEPTANSIQKGMRDQSIAMPFVSGEVIDTCKFLKQFNSQAKCAHACAITARVCK